METLELLKKANERGENSIHLIASESWLPSEARIPYVLDVYSRYVYDNEEDNAQKDEEGLAGTLPQFGGTEELNEIESRCGQILCEMLGGKYTNVKSLSGLNMMISVMGSLVMKNELVLSVPIEGGGHSATKYIIERIGCRHAFIPYEEGTFCIDKSAFEKLVNENTVKMVYVDLMNVISPVDIQYIRKVVGRRTIICYDASHVLGLILGEKFQAPLQEGADIIIGSTHKTFPGPHKGIFVTTNRWYYLLYQLNHLLFISHTHIGDICALTLMVEKGKDFFKDYAERIVTNARVLAEYMRARGLTVYYNASHQIWIDCGEKDITSEVNHCVQNHIYVNQITIPHNGHNGVRIGIQEVTYHRFDKNEMHILGDILCKIFLGENFRLEDTDFHVLIEKQKGDIYYSNKKLLTLWKKIYQNEDEERACFLDEKVENAQLCHTAANRILDINLVKDKYMYCLECAVATISKSLNRDYEMIYTKMWNFNFDFNKALKKGQAGKYISSVCSNREILNLAETYYGLHFKYKETHIGRVFVEEVLVN